MTPVACFVFVVCRSACLATPAQSPVTVHSQRRQLAHTLTVVAPAGPSHLLADAVGPGVRVGALGCGGAVSLVAALDDGAADDAAADDAAHESYSERACSRSTHRPWMISPRMAMV